jgi:hypothetical protein
MQILDEGGDIKVIPTDRTGGRAKALFSAEALWFGVAALVSVSIILINPLVGGAGALVFGIAFWRYYKRVVHREELVIGDETITIITNDSGRRVEREFAIDKVKGMRYIGFERPQDHPLKTGSFDYLGFQTQLEVVNAVMAEGNVAFDYEGQTVRFFIGVPSWELVEVDEVLERKSDGRLFIDGLPEEIPDGEWRGE